MVSHRRSFVLRRNMESKACCFIGHRKIEKSVELTQRVRAVINDLIENKGVTTFLFVAEVSLTICVMKS